MSASDPPTQVTAVLAAAGTGEDRGVFDRLVPLVYEELRRIARSCLARESAAATLSTTALVHEAYLKLVDESRVPVRSRAYFFAAAARAMRQVLVDAARRRHRRKRGAGAPVEELPEELAAPGTDDFAGQVVAVHESLERLAALEPRAARVVELRFFGGLSVEEAAEVIGASPRSVKRDWAFARAWLYRELSGAAPD